MSRHKRTRSVTARFMLAALVLSVLNTVQAAPPSRNEIDAAIKAGIAALLNQITDQDVIEFSKAGKEVALHGKVIKATKDEIRLQPETGEPITITRSAIRHWRRAGLVKQEMEPPHFTGPSTLVAFALVTAGVDSTNRKLTMLLSALENEEAMRMGTYTHSLRACLWSALLDRSIGRQQRERYKKLLQADVDWLIRADGIGGWYSYSRSTGPGQSGDNSNTQFANLGLWAGAIGKVEISNKVWKSMAHHWLESQQPDGGWTYSPTRLNGASRSSMTVAGCNSLYIALDRFYARPEASYRLFEGALITREAQTAMSGIHEAIRRADRYLSLHPADITNSNGYELFGLERLGLAGGLARIGDRDWFRHYADSVAARDWGGGPVADGFALIFLVHGLSPVLLQKLEHGAAVEDWNYYQRDLSALTRSMNRSFERLHRWQRVPVGANLVDLNDAPILYIAGHAALELPKDTLDTIRAYIDNGGTVFLHADRAAKTFVDSATRTYESLFADRRWKFENLADDHPLFRCHHGGPNAPWKRHIPLRAMRDGARLPVILCPVDIAGAWQQERGPFDELYRIMENVRVYCAPPYAELPRVSCERPKPRQAAEAAEGTLSIGRLVDAGASRAHPLAWSKLADTIRSYCPLAINCRNVSVVENDWEGIDLLHITLDDAEIEEEAIPRLRTYATNGGLILVDAVDGQSANLTRVATLLDRIGIGERGILGPDHPALAGLKEFNSPGPLVPTDAGASLGKSPPMMMRTLDGRVCLMACPFDMTAGLDGCFIWNRVGYQTDSTRRLMAAIAKWRYKTRPR